MHRLAPLALIALVLSAAGVASADPEGPLPGEADPNAPPQDVPVGVPDDAYADTDPSAVTDFQQPLAGHGQWVDDPTYGTIWIPSGAEIAPDFAPYDTAGHWAWDDVDGYVWVSDYEWGWVTFHYGRWVWIEERGWCWVPGRTYAGAWVDWYIGAEGYAYVGWAPMLPLWVWRGGVALWIGPRARRGAYYVACPDLFAPRVRDRVIGGDRAIDIARPMHAYVLAEPTVGRVPVPRGPSPSSLLIDAGRVTHPNANDVWLARARAFGRPSTARPLGAHPPTPHVVRVLRPVAPPGASPGGVRGPGAVHHGRR